MAFQSIPIPALQRSSTCLSGALLRNRLAGSVMALGLICSMGVHAQIAAPTADPNDPNTTIGTPMAPRPITNAPPSAAGQPVTARPGTSPNDRAPNDRAPNDRTPNDRSRGDGTVQEAAPTQRAPNPPNEFQRFVAGATGETLPVFGENYFAATAQTFAPLDRVPVPADYILGPGDELFIRTWGNIDIDYRATIDRNGQISIPRVGSFTLAGLRASEMEGRLRSQIGRVFKGFELNVTLGQLRSIQIFVVGQARQPGTYTVGSLSTLVNAVFASGGPGPNGSMRRVQLRRGNSVVTELDLYDFIVGGAKARDAQLMAGDVVVYMPAGPRVALRGAVDTPAIFELKTEGSSLAEIVAIGGGGRVHANLTSAQLERIDPARPKSPRQVVKVELSEAAKTPMRDGDILTVFPVAAQFANAVTLRGNVAQALRYPYTPGMRISQLIPEREALITPDYYIRKNRLVQFTAPRKIDTVEAEQTVRNLVDEPNWEYATIERLDANRITTRLLPFHLGKAVIDRDPANDLVLEAGDIVTIFGSKDIRGPQARANRLVRVEGEIDRPGVYQLQPGETLRALIARAGGFTPQAYVYGLEFSREETRKQQVETLAAATVRLQTLTATQSARAAANRRDDSTGVADAAISTAAMQAQLARLARIEPNGRIALELEPTAASIDTLPDVPLEDADRIRVPARPAFVTVAGAVVNNNAFLWKTGRTAGDYVRLAGLDEGAEISNMFILRADGTVRHATSERGLFGMGGLQSQLLYPGDAVVVPNQLDYETWGRALVRNLKDWSQIFSQFGLGAAAIKTLRN